MSNHTPGAIAQPSDEDYQRSILQRVSRTFGLTIPKLPAPLELVVGNGYLLCRIADTIEDATELSAVQKAAFAAQFADVLRGAILPATFSRELSPLLGEATPEAERELVRNAERVLRITRRLSGPQQAALQRCVVVMLEGMAYFAQCPHGDGLDDMESFERYCYHVAGVVGEMLTEVYCDYSSEMRPHRELLLQLSVAFGQGLQMTNILKDIWEDDQRGRCWLPRSLMRQYGLTPGGLYAERTSRQFSAMLDELIGVAHGHLRQALRYTLLIPPAESGLRRFCFLAIGMALQTLQRLHRNPGFGRGADVKISRANVRTVVALSNVLIRRDVALRLLFAWGARSLPLSAPTGTAVAALRVAYRLPSTVAVRPAPVPGPPQADAPFEQQERVMIALP